MTHWFDKEDIIARKNHCCDWCLKTIKKGTKYTKQSSVDGGDWWIFKTHRLCFHVSIEANKGCDPYCNGPDMGLHDEEIRDILKIVKKDLKKRKNNL